MDEVISGMDGEDEGREMKTYRVYDSSCKVIATIRNAEMMVSDETGILEFYDADGVLCAMIRIWATVVVANNLNQVGSDQVEHAGEEE